MLSFPEALVEEHRLEVGTRLLTINVYRSDLRFTDLKHRLYSYRRYSNFAPVIAEFVSADVTEIAVRKSEIEGWEWIRTQNLATVSSRARFVGQGRPASVQ